MRFLLRFVVKGQEKAPGLLPRHCPADSAVQSLTVPAKLYHALPVWVREEFKSCPGTNRPLRVVQIAAQHHQSKLLLVKANH